MSHSQKMFPVGQQDEPQFMVPPHPSDTVPHRPAHVFQTISTEFGVEFMHLMHAGVRGSITFSHCGVAGPPPISCTEILENVIEPFDGY